MPRINSLLSQVENVVRISTVDNYPDFWEENHITFDLLKGIRRALNYSVIENASNNVTINWRIYKQRKRENERDYGDIALIVKLLYQDKDELEGVAFLEAKRKFENTLAFDSAKTDQLKRIDNHSTTAMMLLYDFNDITKFASIEALSNYRQEWFELRPCTHAVVVPIRTALLLGKYNMSLYKFSLPFSYQLFFRYFNGFDLDFTDSALNIAKGFADAKGMPNYVITATISFNRANDGLTSRVNNEKYVEFNEGSQFKDYYPEG